ncbi:MAG TPA: hypothetical protein VER04_29865 [Polyangiaceae bacterium]|jgi:hypothetical protein|nr:hypothetical protein [Polyangiaceae bacterium]
MSGRFSREIRVICLVSGLAFGLACRKTPEPSGAGSKPGAQESKSSPAAPHAPPVASAVPGVEITWVDPPALRRVPPKSAMRKASYEVPHAAGDTEDGELAVFYFGPGQGGSIDANVDRWVKQFSGISASDVKRADREANGLRQHTVEIEHGSFDAGQMAMGGAKGPKKDYALEGAIVETPGGAYFFKMTGPARTVLAARASFFQLLDSIRAGS